MTQRPTNVYTADGLAWLKSELARKEAQWDNYSGNNPNKGAADRKALRAEITSVTAILKSRGEIPLTDSEILKQQLDRQTPSRLKGCCTLLGTQWYKIKFTGKDEQGLWEWTWLPVSAEEVNASGGGYIHPGPKSP